MANGCQRKAPTGDVSGQVSVAGQPVQFGTIAFLNSAGRVATDNIQNGAYRVTGVPVGTSQVTVQAVKLGTPVGHPTLGPLPETPAGGKFVPVAARYALPQTSALQYDVVEGAQTKDFELSAE